MTVRHLALLLLCVPFLTAGKLGYTPPGTDECVEFIRTGSSAIGTQDTTTGDTGVFVIVDFVDLYTTEMDSHDSFTAGTDDTAEAVFSPPSGEDADFLCSMQISGLHTGSSNPLITVQLATSNGDAVTDGDQERNSNWSTTFSSTKYTQWSETAFVTLQDDERIGLIIAQIGAAATFKTHGYTLHCRQINTNDRPCR